MRHKYFRFLACVAMVLACVMMFEIPVSAFEFTNLSDFITDRYVSNGFHISEYFYPFSNSSKLRVEGYNLPGGRTELKFSSGDHIEISVDKSFKSVTFSLYPNGYYTGYSGVTDLIATPVINPNVIDSFMVNGYAVFFSSAAVSGFLQISGYYLDQHGYLNAFSSDKVSFSLSSGMYFDSYFNFDLLKSLSYEMHGVTFSVNVTFEQVPAGASLSVNFGAPVSNNDVFLDHGLLFTLKEPFAQDAPVFTKNLSSAFVSYLVGESAVPLSVDASVSDGGLLTYQWYKSSSAGSTGSAIPGATGKTYVPDFSVESDFYYYCIASSNLSGSIKTTKSNVAHIAFVKKPVQPVIYANLHTGALEYFQGDAADDLFFGVYVPDGGTLTYQWYQGDGSYGEPSPISGATSASYNPPTDVTGNYFYYCKATNTKGTFTESIWSREGKIIVNPPPDPALPPVITTDLSTEPVMYKEGTSASAIRINAASPDGGVLSYQWYQLVDGVGKPIAGETTAGFRPDTAKPGEYQYYCVVTNTVLNTHAIATSATATIIIAPDRTDSLLDTIIGGVSDIIDGITNLPQMILDGIKGLFVPDVWQIAAYQLKWEELLATRFGAIYEAVMLIDQFGKAISEQAAMGIVTFPEVTIDLAGEPWTFGGWDIKVVPDGFGGVIVVLKSAINIVCTLAFVNGLRHRFEGIMGGA